MLYLGEKWLVESEALLQLRLKNPYTCNLSGNNPLKLCTSFSCISNMCLNIHCINFEEKNIFWGHPAISLKTHHCRSSPLQMQLQNGSQTTGCNQLMAMGKKKKEKTSSFKLPCSKSSSSFSKIMSCLPEITSYPPASGSKGTAKRKDSVFIIPAHLSEHNKSGHYVTSDSVKISKLSCIWEYIRHISETQSDTKRL